MEYKIGERDFDFNCKLGVTMRIKSKFKMTYNQIIDKLETLDVDQLIDLMYCGLAQDQILDVEFKEYIYNNIGMGDLMDAVTWFMKQIQYPGLGEEEIEKKLMEKKEQAEKYR